MRWSWLGGLCFQEHAPLRVQDDSGDRRWHARKRISGGYLNCIDGLQDRNLRRFPTLHTLRQIRLLPQDLVTKRLNCTQVIRRDLGFS